MPEYIYLLEHRLSTAQKHVLTQVRDAAREAGMTVFLTGGAVRDLTTGSSVRNFNFAVQGNALDLEAALVARGAEVWGTHEPTRTLTLWFPGSVRADVASTRSETYPKPGKPVYTWNTIVEDLRRRDFTANAMALSLNEGSYGLLLDPLNGVADIEARLLRIASNYGFIEDPSRLIRATRLKQRLGWQIEERTATRYANAKEAEAIKVLTPYLRGYELEKIASEEDALDIVKALEAEGWMEHLFPAWTSAKADVAGLESLRRNWIQLLMQGVIADLTVAHLELLTSGMAPTEIESLKKALVHPGLVRQWEALDESAKEFGKLLTGKASAAPSATWKLLTTHAAEPILWLAHTRKAGAADAKFKSFFTVWPEFKKKVPAAMMLEMRITPELPGYADLLEQLFYQLIDGHLETDEQMRAFLEPFSPPAPPPPPTIRRSRTKKSESKTKRRISAPDEDEDDSRDEDDEDADETDEVDSDEEDEPVEDEALSKVLEKLHADDDSADDAEDSEDTESEAAPAASQSTEKDADEDGDDEPTPLPPQKSTKRPAASEAHQEEGAPVAAPPARAKAAGRSGASRGKPHGETIAASAEVAPAAAKAAAPRSPGASETKAPAGKLPIVKAAAKSPATKSAPAKSAPSQHPDAKPAPAKPPAAGHGAAPATSVLATSVLATSVLATSVPARKPAASAKPAAAPPAKKEALHEGKPDKPAGKSKAAAPAKQAPAKAARKH